MFFIASRLTLKSEEHFESCMMWDEGPVFASACRYPVFPKPFVEETTFVSLCVLGTSVQCKKFLHSKEKQRYWHFYQKSICLKYQCSILFHWLICLFFTPVSCCLNYYGPEKQFGIRKHTSALFFLISLAEDWHSNSRLFEVSNEL